MIGITGMYCHTQFLLCLRPVAVYCLLGKLLPAELHSPTIDVSLCRQQLHELTVLGHVCAEIWTPLWYTPGHTVAPGKRL